jgi:hypothetical protein
MKSSRWLVTLWLAASLAFVPAAWAQLNAPHLGYVLPAGGRQGTTFQVKVGGQFLNNVTDVFVSGSGIQAAVTDSERPMTPMQATQLRDRLQELQKQPMDAAVQKEMADIRVKLLIFNSTRLTSPVLAETVALQITISPDAEPGKRELRVATQQGMSNPLIFCVGQLPEFNEKETINVNIQPGTNQPQISMPPTNMEITLPATVNGRIKPGLPRPSVPPVPGQQFTPGDADRYRFQARQGQNLVIAVSARDLIPYLADAVPGWFQATLALYDDKGNELAYDDDYRFNPDPVLHYEIPKDGEYTIEIKDALYRGREDFVYRITVGEVPFVTGIFPLGGQAGSQTKVEVQGWNLPVERLTMNAKGKEAGIYPISVRKGDLISNIVPFAVDTLPEIVEKEPNDSQKSAQRVKLPIIVNGRIDHPGDWDVFSFDGRKGDAIVAEVYARRLDSPLDSVLRLTDAAGKQVAFNDDHEDKGFGLITHQADSLISTTLPANGTYYLYLGDAQQKGGPEYAYRLRISPPRPDFDLRVTPSGVNAPGGWNVPITVYALRKDGFSGDIELALKDAPKGFILTGAVVPAGQDQVRLTLTTPLVQLKEPLKLSLEGRAMIQGHEVRRLAVPAEDMMQAFAYHHLVPQEALRVAVPRRSVFKTPPSVAGEQPVKIPAGGTVRLQVQVPIPPNNVIEKIDFELSEPPQGIELGDTSLAQNQGEIVLKCDAAKAKPGTKGNLIITISAERQPPAGNQKAQANRQRVPLGTLPAIPFEIVNR